MLTDFDSLLVFTSYTCYPPCLHTFSFSFHIHTVLKDVCLYFVQVIKFMIAFKLRNALRWPQLVELLTPFVKPKIVCICGFWIREQFLWTKLCVFAFARWCLDSLALLTKVSLTWILEFSPSLTKLTDILCFCLLCTLCSSLCLYILAVSYTHLTLPTIDDV